MWFTRSVYAEIYLVFVLNRILFYCIAIIISLLRTLCCHISQMASTLKRRALSILLQFVCFSGHNGTAINETRAKSILTILPGQAAGSHLTV